MFGKMKAFFGKHKIKFTFVGGVVVLSSAYGTCSVDPDEGAIKDVVIGKDEQPKEEAKPEAKAEGPEKLPISAKRSEEKKAEEKEDSKSEDSKEKEQPEIKEEEKKKDAE